MTIDRRGLTLVEVLIAIVVVTIAFMILSTALVGSLRFTDTAGARTQSAQYLNFLGRRVAGGSADVLTTLGTTRTWGYGALADAFADLPTGAGGRTDAERYRASVENLGDVAFVGISAVQYRITVCTVANAGESCSVALTVGPAPVPGGTAPPLPGIN